MARKTKTPLEDLLNDTQTQKFADYLLRRYQSVIGQLQGEFWMRRKRYHQQMMDDFSWRSGGGSRRETLDRGVGDLANDIFTLNNDSLNIVGGFAAFMTARAVDDIKGTEPYFNIFPEGLADDVLADAMQKHSEWKLRKSNVSECVDDAIDLGFGLGEGVVMLRWEKEIDVFERPANVLYHTGDKAPVQTVTGEYVHNGDEMGSADVPAVDELGQPIPDPLTGEPTTTKAVTVAKDPSLLLDPAMLVFKDMAIEDVNIRYNGIKGEILKWSDFLCPLTEPDVNDSNYIGRKFQMRLSDAIEEFDLDDDVIAEFKTSNNEQKTEAMRPNAEQGETAENYSTDENDDPIILFCESWVRYDPVGDKRMRRIRAVLAVDYRKVVAMDYMANVTPEGILPFFVIRPYRVKNRWYGRGYYETYENAQEFIDRNFNRIEYRNQFHTNPPKFLDTSLLVEEEDTDEPFDLRPGSTWRKKQGVKTEDVFSFANLPDLDERTWQIMQFMIQMIQVRSGITSAAQGEVSSLPSTATATGIESIMQSASTLARLPIGNLKECFEKMLLYGCKLIYANLDQDEVYSYFDGDAQKAGTLIAEQVKGIDINVRLLLTRFKQRESVDNGQKATATLDWYLNLPEQEKAGPRIVAIQVMKGLGFNQADVIVRTPILLQAGDPATGQPIQTPPAQLTLPPPSPGATQAAPNPAVQPTLADAAQPTQ